MRPKETRDSKRWTVSPEEFARLERERKLHRLGLPQTETAFESAIMRIMIELTADAYPDKTAIVTCRPLPWLTSTARPPATIFDLGRLAGWPRIDAPSEPVEGAAGTLVVECSHVSELRERLQHSALSAIIIDHTLPWGGHSAVSQRLQDVLPEEVSTGRHLEEAAGIISLALPNPNVEKVASIMPPGVLFRTDHSYWRRVTLQDSVLRVVVELPAGVFLPQSSLNMALLYFEKPRGKERPSTVFFPLSDRGDLLGLENQVWFNDLSDALSNQPMKTGFSAQVPPDGPWNSGPYSPAATEIQAFLEGIAETQRLGDLCDILLGAQYARAPAGRGSGVPVLRGRDISNPNIETRDLERFNIERGIPERSKAQLGDVLMQRIGENPATLVVAGALENTVVGDTVLILRPNGPDVPSEFIAQFLTSSLGQRLLAARRHGVGAPSMTLAALRDVPIPILPAPAMQDLDEMARVEQQLLEQAEKVRSMRMGLFNVKDREEFEQRLHSLRTQTQVLSSSIVQVDDLRFQIRNFYPLPLAYSLRLLEGIVNPSELYREQLRVAENLLAFIGSVSLALVEPGKERLTVVLAECWRGGISPGHWEDISVQSSCIVEDVLEDSFASVVRSLWRRGNRESEFARTIKRLIQAKNDFKHDRGPRIEEEFKAACEDVGQKLEDCMAAVSFFVQHPIRLVCSMDALRGTSSVTLDTLRYLGDHPGLSQEKVRFPTPLPKDTLYLELAPEKWVSLYPFITVQYCPECHMRETYFIDRWRGHGRPARLKSFERGHTIESIDVGQELEKWAPRERS